MNDRNSNVDILAKDINIKSRTELAKELNVNIPKDGYWGNTTSKMCGIVGGAHKDKG